MKKIILLIGLIMTTIAASAQITWNVKAGVGMSRITGGDGEMKFGWKIGVGIEKPLSENWLVMPTVEFKQKGSNFNLNNDVYFVNNSVSISYIQIPVMAAYRTRVSDEVNMTLKAGPYFAYAVSGECNMKLVDGGSESWDIFEDEEDFANRFDAGIALGVDFEYHRFVCGVEGEYGLVKIVGVENTYSNKNLGIYVTVGYKF